MTKISDIIFVFGMMLVAYCLFTEIYKLGYLHGNLTSQGWARTNYVKKRTIQEGNIFKYPFRNAERETTQSSDCDSVTESGSEKKDGES